MKKILLYLFIFCFFVAGIKIYTDFSHLVFKIGKTADIRWNKIEGDSPSGNIIIKHNNVVIIELKNAKNDGEERIKIPNDIPLGKYQIFLYWNNFSNGPNNASGEKLVGIFYVVSSQLGDFIFVMTNLIFVVEIILIFLLLFIFIKKNYKKIYNYFISLINKIKYVEKEKIQKIIAKWVLNIIFVINLISLLIIILYLRYIDIDFYLLIIFIPFYIMILINFLPYFISYKLYKNNKYKKQIIYGMLMLIFTQSIIYFSLSLTGPLPGQKEIEKNKGEVVMPCIPIMINGEIVC